MLKIKPIVIILNTKDKIINVAKKLFIENGYNGTTVRGIAIKAGVNLALLNYHFKSKDSLFTVAIEKILIKLTPPLHKILESDLPLEAKIRKYIGSYIDLLVKNPNLVLFVLNIVSKCPERLVNIKAIDNLYNSDVFRGQLREEIEKGNIREVDPEQLFVSILSMIAFPFALKQFIAQRNNFSDKEFDDFFIKRKKIIFEMIINHLKIN